MLVDAMSSRFGEPLDITQDRIDFVKASAKSLAELRAAGAAR